MLIAFAPLFTQVEAVCAGPLAAQLATFPVVKRDFPQTPFYI